MGNELLTTAEVSKLLNLNEKKIYTLAQEGIIPATKLTGKWLFPHDELITHLKYSSLKNIKKGIPLSLIENDILLGAGSDDPILSKIFSQFFKIKNTNIFYTTNGSKNGIELLKNKVVHFSLSHLYNKEQDSFNTFYLGKIFPEKDFVIIEFFFREVGLLYKDNSANKEKKTFVLRQSGSGTRELSDQFFKTGILKRKNYSFHSEELNTHFDIARLINDNKDFVGIATKSSAKTFGLKFKKLFDERFDIITLKDYFFEETFQAFLNYIKESTAKELKNLDGYNFTNTGKIIS